MLDGVIGRLLEGVQIRSAGVGAVICRDHLGRLGAHLGQHDQNSPSGAAARLEVGVGRGAADIECTIGWVPAGAPSMSTLPSEPLVQAACGLMSVHGRDTGVPRLMHGGIVTTTSSVLASQVLLGGLLARSRGRDVARVQTSVFGAGLFLINHHIAIATSGGQFPDVVHGLGRPPPFVTLDGQWFELEALSGEDWRAFWASLQVEAFAVVAHAWLPYVYRYLAGRCAVPAELHQATGQHTMAEIRAIAFACNVAVCAVRSTRSWPLGTPHQMPAPPDVNSIAPWSLATMDAVGTGRAWPDVSNDRPLTGMRVIELGTRLQAPLAGLMLQMLGAKVVKIEPPGGDFGRGSPPLAGSIGAAYLAYNRGKRRVELDYKTAAGRAELLDLVNGSDVFLHNLRAGRAERLELDAGALGRCNPTLVHAYTSGWGDEPTPPSEIAGDYLVQAYAGCGDDLNASDQPPFPTRVTLVDVMGGLLGTEAVLAALLAREASGRGYRVQTSLLGAAAVLRQGARRRPPDDPHLLDLDMVVRTDLAGLSNDAIARPALEPTDGGCWVPTAPWRIDHG